MTLPEVISYDHAGDLPEAWERAAGPGFLSREILALLELVNPCGQRYHLVTGAPGRMASLAVTYLHRMDLLTFGPRCLRWRMPVRMVGVPCSVSVPGLVLGAPETAASLLSHLGAQPGLALVLNMNEGRLNDRFVSGHTLPSCRLRVAWPDFDAYLAAMRSSHRRRIRLAQKRGAGLTAERIGKSMSFGDELHALYLSVFRQSKAPLECLPVEFFRTFPGEITVFRVGSRPAGFVQTVRQGDRLVFLFGGLDYSLLRAHDTYWNMLLHIVRLGIETGCREIELGQTAEIVKCRLGCGRVPLYLHATHPAPGVRWLLRRAAGWLCYTPPQEEPHVFRA